MKIDNIRNYPGVENSGVFSNSAEPVLTPNGSTAFLVSNYAGLYGVALARVSDADVIHDATLLFVTDNYSYAASQLAAMAPRH